MTAEIVASGIVGISTRVEGIASTSLDILRAVDMTVDALGKEQRVLSDAIEICGSLRDDIQYLGDFPLDTEGKLAAVLETAEASAKRVLSDRDGRRQSAMRDPRLQGDHEDAVVDEYECLMEEYRNLIQVLISLRWAVLEHDADLETPEGAPFESAEDLIADLRR